MNIDKKVFTKIWRWSVLFMIGIATYWLVYYLKNGFVPAPDTVGFIQSGWSILKLNFPVSRWFDVLSPILWLSLIFIWWKRLRSIDENHMTTLNWVEVVILILSGIVGFIVAIAHGIVSGFVTSLIFALGTIMAALVIVLLRYIFRWANGK